MAPQTAASLKKNAIAVAVASAVAATGIFLLPARYGQIMGWANVIVLSGSSVGAMLVPLLEDLGLIVAAATLFVGVAVASAPL